MKKSGVHEKEIMETVVVGGRAEIIIIRGIEVVVHLKTEVTKRIKFTQKK